MLIRWCMLAVLALSCRALGQEPSATPSPQGDAPSSSTPAPQLVVKERSVDMGRMREGDKVRATFLLENRGNAPIQIIEVSASCGCTVPRRLTDDEKIMEPGESLEVEAEFNSTGRLGRQTKTVTVHSNDPHEPRMQLTLTGEVVTIVEVLIDGRVQGTIPLKRTRVGQRAEVKIEVLPTDPGRTLEFTTAELRHDSLAYEIAPLTRDDRTGFEVILSATTDAVPGPVAVDFQINGKIGDEGSGNRLRVTGEIVGEISFLPTEIRQTSPIVRGTRLTPIKIRSESRQPFELLSINTDPNITFEVVPHAEKIEYAVIPSIAANARPGPLGAVIDIRTNSVAQPSIVVPLFVLVRPGLEVYPQTVFLRADDGDKTGQRIVKIESATRGPFEITGIDAGSNYLTAAQQSMRIESAVGVRHVRIALTGEVPSGRHEATVRLKTNMVDQPELIIPVTIEAP